MSTDISIKNGADLNLKGLASMELEVAKKSLNYALNPDDFFGLIPRMLVKEGEKVSKGQPVFHDKNDDSIKICLLYTSPSPRDLSTSRMPSSA